MIVNKGLFYTILRLRYHLLGISMVYTWILDHNHTLNRCFYNHHRNYYHYIYLAILSSLWHIYLHKSNHHINNSPYCMHPSTRRHLGFPVCILRLKLRIPSCPSFTPHYLTYCHICRYITRPWYNHWRNYNPIHPSHILENVYSLCLTFHCLPYYYVKFWAHFTIQH